MSDSEGERISEDNRKDITNYNASGSAYLGTLLNLN